MDQTLLNLPLTESPFFDELIKEAPLDDATKELAKQFAQNGFVIFDPQLAPQLIDQVRQSLLPAFAEANTNRLQDAWQTNEAVRQLAAAPRVLQLLRDLYGREPIPFQTLNFSTGSQQRTHSDSIHFSSVPERFLAGVWIALEDITDDNGPLHYYPASHKLPSYNLSTIGLKGSASSSINDMLINYYTQYENFIAKLVDHQKLTKQVLHLKKGQAMIWSANLLHGGEPIRKPGATRYTQVNHYFFADCAYYRPMQTDMILERVSVQKVVNVATGETVESNYLGTPIKHVGYSYKLYLPSQLMRSVLPTSLRQWVKKLINR